MNPTRSERTYEEALAQIAGALSLVIGKPNTGDYVDCIIAHIRGALDREHIAWTRWQTLYDVLTEIANQDYRGNRSPESQIAYNALRREHGRVTVIDP